MNTDPARAPGAPTSSLGPHFPLLHTSMSIFCRSGTCAFTSYSRECRGLLLNSVAHVKLAACASTWWKPTRSVWGNVISPDPRACV